MAVTSPAATETRGGGNRLHGAPNPAILSSFNALDHREDVDMFLGACASWMLVDDDRGGEVLRPPWQTVTEEEIQGEKLGVLTVSSSGTQRRWWRGLGWLNGGEIGIDLFRLRRRLELEFDGYGGALLSIFCRLR